MASGSASSAEAPGPNPNPSVIGLDTHPTESETRADGREGQQYEFSGRPLREQRFAVVTFPGRRKAAWEDCIQGNTTLACSCVYFPDSSSMYYGLHTETCKCAVLYKGVHPSFPKWEQGLAEWGCKWFDKYCDNLKDVRDFKQVAIIVYDTGMLGRDEGLGYSQRGEVKKIREMRLPSVSVDVEEFTNVLVPLASEPEQFSGLSRKQVQESLEAQLKERRQRRDDARVRRLTREREELEEKATALREEICLLSEKSREVSSRFEAITKEEEALAPVASSSPLLAVVAKLKRATIPVLVAGGGVVLLVFGWQPALEGCGVAWTRSGLQTALGGVLVLAGGLLLEDEDDDEQEAGAFEKTEEELKAEEQDEEKEEKEEQEVEEDVKEEKEKEEAKEQEAEEREAAEAEVDEEKDVDEEREETEEEANKEAEGDGEEKEVEGEEKEAEEEKEEEEEATGEKEAEEENEDEVKEEAGGVEKEEKKKAEEEEKQEKEAEGEEKEAEEEEESQAEEETEAEEEEEREESEAEEKETSSASS